MTPERGMYTIAFGMHREKGLVRQENQDQIVYFQSSVYGHVFIVADGMGGHEGGAMAANMAITGFKQHFQNLSLKLPLRESIAEAAKLTNLDIFDMSNSKGDGSNPLRMGSTLVVCVISGNFCTVANAGDSRCYSFRNGELKLLTKDHTAAQKMVDSGLISPEEAKTHPESSVLTRAFGQRPEIEVDIRDPFELAPEERLLLCSDGLYGYVDETLIVDSLKKHSDPQAAADALLQLALDAGGHDNISIFVIHVERPAIKSGTAPDPPLEALSAVTALPAVDAAESVRAAARARRQAASLSKSGRPIAMILLAVSAMIAGSAALTYLRPDLLPVRVRQRLAAWGVPAAQRFSSEQPVPVSPPPAQPRVPEVEKPRDNGLVPKVPDQHPAGESVKPLKSPPAGVAPVTVPSEVPVPAQKLAAPPDAVPPIKPGSSPDIAPKPAPAPETAPGTKPAQFAASPSRPSVFITFPPTENPNFLGGVADFREQLLSRGYRTALSPKSLQQAVWRPVAPHPASFAPARLHVSALFLPGFRNDAVSVCALLSCSERQPRQIAPADFKTFEHIFPGGGVIVFVHPPVIKQNPPPIASPSPAPRAGPPNE